MLIGAHFDSWHGATGATDNAAGNAAMMEAMRILKDDRRQPRRTIRIGLWGGEEEGCSDRRPTFASTSAIPRTLQLKPEQAKFSAYFNLDNGTGKIRGIWMQGNTGVAPVFEALTAPLKDLGVEILEPALGDLDRPQRRSTPSASRLSVRAGTLRVQLAHAPLEHGLRRSRAARGHEANGDGRRDDGLPHRPARREAAAETSPAPALSGVPCAAIPEFSLRVEIHEWHESCYSTGQRDREREGRFGG